MPYRTTDIAIVGGGASGVLLAARLVRHGGRRRSITLVDRGPVVGLGIAYATRSRAHLLNIPAGEMSALAEEPGHFAEWLARHGGGGADTFACRQLYGRYLCDVLNEAVRLGRGSLRVVTDEVSGMEPTCGGVRLSLVRAGGLQARAAVLATGHHAPAADRGAYRGNPWRADLLDDLAPDDAVLLIGTGLTMVDVVLSLRERGHGGPILAVSRRGLLPRSHPEQAPSADGDIDVEGLFTGRLSTRLRRFRAAVEGGRQWEAVMQALRSRNAALWASLDRPEQRRFLRHLRPWWDIHRHRVAPPVGRALAAVAASGQLTVLAGRIVGMEAGAGKVTARIRRRGRPDVETCAFARVIDCSGPRNAVDPGSALQTALAADGRLRSDRLGLGLEVDENDALIDASGAPSNRLFALGPPTRGRHWEIVAIPDIRRRAARLARHLLSTVLPADEAACAGRGRRYGRM